MGAAALIGVFGAIVGAVTIRRKTPRVVELAAWIGLIVACILAIAGTRSGQARMLTSAGIWGATQLAGSLARIVEQGTVRWLFTSRFAIAGWMVLILGADLLALALLATRRSAERQMPVARLGGWFLLPVGARRPASQRASALQGFNQRLSVLPAAVTTTLAAGALYLLRSGDGGAPARVVRPEGSVHAAPPSVSPAIARPKKAVGRKRAGAGPRRHDPRGVTNVAEKRDGQSRLAS